MKSLSAGFRFLLLILLLEALPGAAWAQSGKLAGTVTDAETGEPIPGATVLITETGLGTATDLEGRYSIIGITPGTYDVRFSFVGYTTRLVEGIRVTSDRTTTLDVELSTEVVQGQELVVEAARPVVDQNQTTSRTLVTSEEISRLPVTDLSDVIARTANAYDGYIRGSRRFETKTVLEGIDISDTFYAIAPNATNTSFAGQVYSNTNRADETNPSMFSLNPSALEEVTVNSGATDPRYATASGGVVAITLAEQRGPIRGSASFRAAPSINRPGPDSLAFYTDADEYFQIRQERIANDDPRANLMTWTEDKYATGDDPEIDARFNLGGSITDNWSFSLNGQWFQTNGYMPNQFAKRLGGQLKSTYRLSNSSRVTVLGMAEDRGLWGNWNNRSYVDFFRYYLEGVAQNDGGSYLGSLKWTQIFSESSYLDVQVYRTYQRTRYGYVDDNGNGFTDVGEDGDFLDFTDPAVVEQYIGSGQDRDRMFYENISDQFGDSGLLLPGGLRFRSGQPMPYSEDALQSTNGARLDYVNQVTFNHLLNVGAELKLRSFEYEEVYGVDQSGSKLNPVVEPFIYHNWERSPMEASLYASDRMEYAGLIVNLGLRLDFIDRDTEEIVDFFHPFRRDTVMVGDNALARNVFERGDKVPMDVFLNPSIGVSHPIGTTASMYFSFARNQQLLPYTTLYSFYDGNSSNSPFFTYRDPNAAPITSNNYEVGVQWEFAEGWGADLNAYMRSIENYGQATLQATNRNPEGETTLVGNFHNFATSAGYADVRGIELVLRRSPLQLMEDFTLGLTASYTYSSVEQANFAGDNQTQFASSGPEETELPFENTREFKNFPQNVSGGSSALIGGYDRTHRFVVRSVASLPYGINLGLTGNLESGFLYPRVLNADPRDRDLLVGPTNYQIDVRLEKRFSFADRFGVDVYLDVTNLTDHNNVVAYETGTPDGPAVFEETGVPGRRLIQADGTSLYGPARNIYFGSRIRF